MSYWFAILEYVWLTITTVSLVIGVRMFNEARRDLAAVRKHRVFGCTLIIAEAGVTARVWRLLAMFILWFASVVSFTVIPNEVYREVPVLYGRGWLWLLLSIFLGVSAYIDARTRNALREHDASERADVRQLRRRTDFVNGDIHQT